VKGDAKDGMKDEEKEQEKVHSKKLRKRYGILLK